MLTCEEGLSQGLADGGRSLCLCSQAPGVRLERLRPHQCAQKEHLQFTAIVVMHVKWELDIKIQQQSKLNDGSISPMEILLKTNWA